MINIDIVVGGVGVLLKIGSGTKVILVKFSFSKEQSYGSL